MSVFGVADLATVMNRTRFDKRKRVIAPEPWPGWLSYRSGHFLRPSDVRRFSGYTAPYSTVSLIDQYSS